MAIVLNHVAINIPTGTHEYGPANVPNNGETFIVRLARCTDATPQFWPNPATSVKANVWMSTDGGATWPFIVIGFGAEGGIYIRRDGVQSPESSAQGFMQRQGGRQIKAEVIVENGPLLSELTVEII